MELTTTDVFGYSAMVLVTASFLFSKIKIIRTVNLLGAIAFVIYGVMLDVAYPIIATNSIIIIIQVYYLIKLSNVKNE